MLQLGAHGGTDAARVTSLNIQDFILSREVMFIPPLSPFFGIVAIIINDLSG